MPMLGEEQQFQLYRVFKKELMIIWPERDEEKMLYKQFPSR